MRILYCLPAATFAAAILLSAVSAQEAETPEPGKKIRERTTNDVAVLLPQAGAGGSPTAKCEAEVGTPKQVKIEAEGAEKLKGYVITPSGMDKAKKYGLVFSFVGDAAKDCKEEVKVAAAMSDGRDPLIACAVEFRLERKIEDNFYSIEYIEQDATIRHAAYSWLLQKVMKDYPVDPERVFVVGAWGDNRDVTEWAKDLWNTDADKFPFRAILMDGLPSDRADALPPVPLIITNDKYFSGSVKTKRRAQNAASPLRAVNELMAMGIPCQFHEYESKFVAISFERGDYMRGRWQVIMRDAIQTLGGPGLREYADGKPAIGVVTKVDAPPFADSNDPIVADVINIARAEEWGRAARRMKAALDDKSVKPKDKKGVQDFQKTFEKYVKDEMERCNKSIETSIKADAWAHSLHKARLAAMVEAFKDEKWCQGKPYAANLEKLKAYPLALREKARRDKMLEAVRMELTGDRAKAKELYQAMVKMKEEDGGYSDWPRAAEYRLSWWADYE